MEKKNYQLLSKIWEDMESWRYVTTQAILKIKLQAVAIANDCYKFILDMDSIGRLKVCRS